MERAGAFQRPEEVAKLVGTLIGHNDFSEYIIKEGLSSRAFSRLEKEDLKGFVSSKTKKGPLVGELMELLAYVDECKKITASAKQVCMPAKTSLPVQPVRSNATKVAQSSSNLQGSANIDPIAQRLLGEMTEQPEGSTAEVASGSSRKRQSKRNGSEVERDPGDFTDHEIFATPYQCSHLEPVFGSFFCQTLRGRFYAALKANFVAAMGKLSNERILAINFQNSAADRKIRDCIVKKTMKDLDGGQIVGCGMVFTWPATSMHRTLSDMMDSHKLKLKPGKAAAKKMKLKATRDAKRIKLSSAKDTPVAPELIGQTVELYGLHQADETSLEVPEKVALGRVTALLNVEGKMTVQILELVEHLETLPSLDVGMANVSELVKGRLVEWPKDDRYWSTAFDQSNEGVGKEDSVVEPGNEADKEAEVTSPYRSGNGGGVSASRGLGTFSTEKTPRNRPSSSILPDVGTNSAGVTDLEQLEEAPSKEPEAAKNTEPVLAGRGQQNDGQGACDNAKTPAKELEKKARPLERRHLPERTRKAPGRYRDHADDCVDPNGCDGGCLRSGSDSESTQSEGGEETEDDFEEGDDVALSNDVAATANEQLAGLEGELSLNDVDKHNYGLIARLLLGKETAPMVKKSDLVDAIAEQGFSGFTRAQLGKKQRNNLLKVFCEHSLTRKKVCLLDASWRTRPLTKEDVIIGRAKGKTNEGKSVSELPSKTPLKSSKPAVPQGEKAEVPETISSAAQNPLAPIADFLLCKMTRAIERNGGAESGAADATGPYKGFKQLSMIVRHLDAVLQGTERNDPKRILQETGKLRCTVNEMLKTGRLELCGEDTKGWNEQVAMLTSYEQQAAEAAAAGLTPEEMGLERPKLHFRDDFRFLLPARSNNGKA